MKKKDLVLIVALLLVAAVSWGLIQMMQGEGPVAVTSHPEKEGTAETTEATTQAVIEEATEEITEAVTEAATEGTTAIEGSIGNGAKEEAAKYGIRIWANGDIMGVYSLAEDQTIDIYGTNVCEIKDGAATMVHADCPDQLCMSMGSITSAYGLIVCLPNAVIIEGVEVAPDEAGIEIDGVS